jgi:hypothetical protein
VANRHESAFRAEVEYLQDRIGGDYQLIPVWWANLGGKTEYLSDTLPDMAAMMVRAEGVPQIDETVIAELLRGAIAVGPEQEDRSDEQQQELVLRAALGQLGPAVEVRSHEQMDELEQAIRNAWQETTYLRLVRSEAVLEAVGRAVGVAAENVEPSDGSEGEVLTRTSTETEVKTRSIREQVGRIAHAVIGEIDTVVGGVIGQVVGDVNQRLRAAWAEPIGRFLGDIVAYQSKQTEIQGLLSKAIREHAPGWGVPGKPISVIAHSLGGVIAFDAATRSSDALWIDGFVTFGSQAAFFQVLDPRPSLPLYIPGNPIILPETIERWTSLWEPLDVLAFAAGNVFRLHSGLAPTDVRLVHDLHSGLATHGTYWRSNELVTAIQQTLPPL